MPRPHLELRAVVSIILLLLATAVVAEARKGEPPLSRSASVLPLDAVQVLHLEPVDREARLAEDKALADGKVGAPLRYGMQQLVDTTPDSAGTWERLPDGARLWRLRLWAPGATDLSCGFTTFRLPPGATLHLLGEGDELYQGPYGATDNKPHRQLWTPVVLGERAVVELYVPAEPDFEPELHLTSVIRGYRDLFGKTAESGDQGTCNIDVICDEGAEWRNEIRSVAMVTLFGGACTGTMMMNTREDFQNLFLSAYHCGINAATAPGMVFYWNFESPECGRNSGGSLQDNQTGATFLASRADSDFALVELDSDPDPESGVYYTGWDAAESVPQGSVAIHQPSAAEKSISFNDDTLTVDTTCLPDAPNSPNTHWYVDNWEVGTTEHGSSGGGLWNPDSHRLVGYLSGGLASCTNINYDCFGRLFSSWNGSAAANRLKDWLDPDNTGQRIVDGAEPVPRLSYGRFQGTSQCGGATSASWKPGATVAISVDLVSSGSFTGIEGTLTSATSGVTIVDGTATWPNMGPGDLTGSSAPHFTVQLGSGVTCPGDVALDLNVSSDQGAALSATLSAKLGVEADTPVSIRDLETVVSTIEAVNDVQLTDVNVQVTILHSWVGDLTITLRSPAGTTVTLLERPGVANDTDFGCGDEDMDVTFDDSAVQDLADYCEGSTPWFTGTARPAESLAAFNGESALGTWTLSVSDAASGDVGVISDWHLVTTPDSTDVCAPCQGTTEAPEPRRPSGRVRPVSR